MVKQNNKKSLILQERFLKSVFPTSITRRDRENTLTWICSITPSPLSKTYKLKLFYRKNEGVKIYVIEPKPLVLADGKTSLPHVYSTKEQILCLYYPKNNEWNVGFLYVDTLIPWACEWLLHYEFWLITTEWNGGGTHH